MSDTTTPMENVRPVDPNATDEEQKLETTLRPHSFDDFIGQAHVKDHLRITLDAARGRNEVLEHILLYGNPGLGKTTLANIVAKEMGSSIHVTSGPAIERAGDLAAILTNLNEGDVLFIDECHRLHKTVEEVLYPAMEDFAFDIVLGKGPTAKTIRLDLPRFTLVAATTRLSMLSAPFRDRFGMTYHLNYYEPEEIGQILKRSATLMNLSLSSSALSMLALRSRATPRVANRLLKRVRDIAQLKGANQVEEEHVGDAMKLLNVDTLGLDAIDRHILETIIGKFSGGPVGLNTLAAATQEEMATIEDIYEPFLIKLGLLARTPRGRVATTNAYLHLNLSLPQQAQQQLIT